MALSRLRPILCLPVLVVVLGLTSPVGAQSTQDKVGAEALFSQARKLMKDGKYDEACAKFEQSQRLDPGIGTLLYLADCYEKTKRYASAWATFREGASEARASGQNERANAGEARANALEPKLSKLTVNVAKENESIANVSVLRGSTAVPKEVWGVAVPVDGGEYVIKIAAPGHVEWQTKVKVAADHDSAKVDVPALVKDENAVTEPAPPAPTASAPVVTPPPPAQDSGTTRDGSTQRVIGVAVAGVGVVGIGFGTLFGLRAISKNSDAKDLCDGATCRDEEGVTLTDDAKSAATISNIAFGAGFACLAGGIVLYLTAPSAPKQSASRRSLHVTPLAAPRAGGFSLGGTF
jgi:serine/threonine-protein kinase